MFNNGTRVYYTGDMANIEAEGTICKVYNDPRWGISYDIVFDDGRLFRKVSPLSFQEGPGRRFYLLTEWIEKRESKIKAFIEKYGR